MVGFNNAITKHPMEEDIIQVEEETVLTAVRTWLRLRKQADAAGAAKLSTHDIMVRTPLGTISGLERVTDQVYKTALPEVEATEVEAMRFSPGVWTVSREYTVEKSGTKFKLLQEWLVLCKQTQPGKAASPLIAEVVSSVVEGGGGAPRFL
jgi:hypothetical protein